MNLRSLLLGLALSLLTGLAVAHKPSDSYLALTIDGRQIRGQWDIALRDLDFAVGLDADGNGEITWGEVRARHSDIAAYALARLTLASGDQSCAARATEHLIDTHSDGAYAVLRFTAECAAEIRRLDAGYQLFFDLDRQHKGLLRLEHGGTTSTGVFTPERASQAFALGAPDRWQQFVDYVVEGIWHIWIGIDHILFLLSLLLPAVMLWQKPRWIPVPGFRPAFVEVLKVVTAFTVAHSITLSIATFGVVELPTRLVESVIALSVVLAALNNILPRVDRARWAVAFGFGLIHGFGFASVLADLGLREGTLVLALVGFNVGVELGQLAIVALFLPLAFLARDTAFYRQLILYGGSSAIAALATAWMIERAFNLKFMPF